MMHRLLGILAAVSCVPLLLHSQGTLSTQGFGYPPGQLSARAQASGGAIAELDPLSPVNPAALPGWERSGAYFQYSPEFRQVLGTEEENERSVVSRFPVIAAALRVSERGMLGVSVSTLLDNTWQTESRLLVGSGSDTSTASTVFRSTGAINDIRVAGSYIVRNSLRVGFGFHVFAGESRRRREVLFSDSTRLSFFQDQAFGFSGKAVSGGIEWRPLTILSIGASARVGGRITASIGDSALRRTDAPTRAGVGVHFRGIAGTLLAARAEWQGWSSLDDLSARDDETHNSWDMSFGAEAKGPRWFGYEIPVRAGARFRTLPFGTPEGGKVRETGISAGFGLPLARNRASADFAVERDQRSGPQNLRERAWTLSFGFLIRL
ncbi:MAG: hypothetical protein H7Z74_05010 [Anaerolineae bacterium]|nr:hypothetical protein [Gemmatimonadaceae bacterium]